MESEGLNVELSFCRQTDYQYLIVSAYYFRSCFSSRIVINPFINKKSWIIQMMDKIQQDINIRSTIKTKFSL